MMRQLTAASNGVDEGGKRREKKAETNLVITKHRRGLADPPEVSRWEGEVLKSERGDEDPTIPESLSVQVDPRGQFHQEKGLAMVPTHT